MIKVVWLMIKVVFDEFLELIEALLRYLPGRIGRIIRRCYYSRKLKSCGDNLIVDIGVEILGCEYISVGDNVWIGAYTYIEAGDGFVDPTRVDNRSSDRRGKRGLVIGKGVSIGRFNIIAAQNEIVLKDFATTSANVCLYSLSHDYINRLDTSQVVGSNIMASLYIPVAVIGAPIEIGVNSWIGLNVCVFGAKVGDNVVVTANNIICRDLGDNLVFKGCGDTKIRF